MPDIDLTEMHALAERAADAAYDRWCHEPAGDADTHDLARRAARAAVDTVVPLVIEQARRQALTEAYWKIREHASAYRSTNLFRRAWERWEDNRDDVRAERRYFVHEFYARGLTSAAADDVGELLGLGRDEEPSAAAGGES